jgi:hypothetical protein
VALRRRHAAGARSHGVDRVPSGRALAIRQIADGQAITIDRAG